MVREPSVMLPKANRLEMGVHNENDDSQQPADSPLLYSIPRVVTSLQFSDCVLD
jgi:hypothetical protein